MAKATRTPIVTEREKVIGVRVTTDEYELIQRKAESMGLRAAAYVRMLALQNAAERPNAEFIKEVYSELDKLRK